MYKYQANSLPNTRIDVADILRAVAIGGIVVIHFLEHMNFYSFPAEPEGFWGAVGTAIWDAVFFLGGGKMYAIFSLLFGLSFFIQHDNQAQKGVDFRPRFLWRMVLLFVFALIDLSFYNGDILCVYAPCAILVLPLIKLSNKALLWIMLFFAIQPVEIAGMIIGAFNPEMRALSVGSGRIFMELMPAQMGTDILEVARIGVTKGVHLNVGWALENGRLTQTLCLFLAGILLGRKRLFYNEGNNLKFWKNVLIASVAGFAVVMIASEFAPRGRDIFHSSLRNMLAMWRNLSMTAFYVSGIVLLYYKTKCGARLIALAPYGKMSLTHYLGSSIIGAFLFYGWGLGLYRYCDHTVSFLMGVGLVVLQWVFSYYWSKKHKRGPLEQIWNTLTWLPKCKK